METTKVTGCQDPARTMMTASQQTSAVITGDQHVGLARFGQGQQKGISVKRLARR